jgi:filamentous hemagglutinin
MSSATANVYRATAVSSATILGATVTLDAGRDITVKGSNIISDKATSLIADRDITITSATSTYRENNFKSVKRSGLMGSGGFGVFIGSKSQSTKIGEQNVTQVGFTVASLAGTYHQTSSDVFSPKGGIDISTQRM